MTAPFLRCVDPPAFMSHRRLDGRPRFPPRAATTALPIFW